MQARPTHLKPSIRSGRCKYGGTINALRAAACSGSPDVHHIDHFRQPDTGANFDQVWRMREVH